MHIRPMPEARGAWRGGRFTTRASIFRLGQFQFSGKRLFLKVLHSNSGSAATRPSASKRVKRSSMLGRHRFNVQKTLLSGENKP